MWKKDANEKIKGEPVGHKTVVGLVGKRSTVVRITSKLESESKKCNCELSCKANIDKLPGWNVTG